VEDLEQIKITIGEVNDPRVDEMVAREIGPQRTIPAGERAAPKVPFYYNPMFVYAIAGGLGALLVQLGLEPFLNEAKRGGEDSPAGLFLFPLMGASIGLFIAAADAILSRNPMRALRSGVVGLGVGALSGIVGMVAGGIIFFAFTSMAVQMYGVQRFREDHNITGVPFFLIIVGRALAWTIVALGMGVGQGVSMKSKKLVLNGLVGGVIGGFLGGLCFDPIDKIMHGGQFGDEAGSSRMIGCALIGLAVGFFIGLVESIAKDAWLYMKAGPLAGKEFVIYKDPTVLGSAPKCDVYLFKDAAIEPRHAEIRSSGLRYELVDLGSKEGTYVNGARVERRLLETGDTIVLGETVLQYAEREKR
jgi:hypothetical protein